MLPSVKIEDIEAVIKIAECRHFTRAGQELRRHQTAVSRSAERLESAMGVKLFDRTSHPIRPTRAGVALSMPASARYRRGMRVDLWDTIWEPTAPSASA